MRNALDETDRRRAKQVAYNLERGLDPQPLRKKIADITDLLAREDADTEQLISESEAAGTSKRRQPVAVSELLTLIEELTAQMHVAAGELQFELAARLRDEVSDLKRELRGMQEAVGR
jgi:excinuclease ABC subunit B